MGREIRRVPPNWDHPRSDEYGDNRYQPMFDQDYESAKREWIEGLMAWEDGTHKDRADNLDCDWWDWEGGPPDRKYYRTWKEEEATWFQVWETVSEGTPVSPPFETEDELVDYLAANGDFWDQRRGHGPWSRESAERFVKEGCWRPSFMISAAGAKPAKDM